MTLEKKLIYVYFLINSLKECLWIHNNMVKRVAGNARRSRWTTMRIWSVDEVEDAFTMDLIFEFLVWFLELVYRLFYIIQEKWDLIRWNQNERAMLPHIINLFKKKKQLILIRHWVITNPTRFGSGQVDLLR